MGDYNNLAADQHQMRGEFSLSDVLKMCSSARVSLPRKGKENKPLAHSNKKAPRERESLYAVKPWSKPWGRLIPTRQSRPTHTRAQEEDRSVHLHLHAPPLDVC